MYFFQVYESKLKQFWLLSRELNKKNVFVESVFPNPILITSLNAALELHQINIPYL